MKIQKTKIKELYCIQNKKIEDERGSFIKVFQKKNYEDNGIQVKFDEVFFSVSIKNVLRGFHFQNPPYDLQKLIWVTHGEILDVVIDLRKNSKTFGKCHSEILNDKNNLAIFTPVGIGHAFLCLSERCHVIYCTSNHYSAVHDSGVRWNSVDFNWPIDNPILSIKDKSLPTFESLESQF